MSTMNDPLLLYLLQRTTAETPENERQERQVFFEC